MFYVHDEPEGTFIYTETIKLYCICYNGVGLSRTDTCYNGSRVKHNGYMLQWSRVKHGGHLLQWGRVKHDGTCFSGVG